MSKQDRQGVRSPADLEQKYSFGKKFSELLGLIDDARKKVDSVESTLRSEIKEQVTSITRNTEQIIMSALETYAVTSDLEELERTVQAELEIMADRISLNFESATEQINNVNGELQTVSENLSKHFDFGVDGLTIRGEGNSLSLLLDNDMIKFLKNGVQFGWWDGVDFHTGNIVIELNERAQFGNFAFVPRSNGSLDFLKVGG